MTINTQLLTDTFQFCQLQLVMLYLRSVSHTSKLSEPGAQAGLGATNINKPRVGLPFNQLEDRARTA